MMGREWRHRRRGKEDFCIKSKGITTLTIKFKRKKRGTVPKGPQPDKKKQ